MKRRVPASGGHGMMNDASGAHGALRWCFEDRATGRIVVGQMPNLPLWIFAAAWTTSKLVHPAGLAGKASPWVASASLAVWSLDEIVRGVNPWRRSLGTGVLILEAVSWFKR